MSKILIKLATKNRPAQFERAIENILETISHTHEFKIEVSRDTDDKTFRPHWFDYENTKFRLEPPTTKIGAINRNMDVITQQFDWDILINFSDDMKFVTRYWDIEIVNIFKKNTLDSFLHLNDGYLGEALPTMSVMGREYYERFFYIYPPCYASFSCDAEAMFVAQMLGKWHYYPEVLFKHEHPANNVMIPSDDLYESNQLHMKEDTIIYFKRLKKLFYVNNPSHIPELMKPYL